MSKKGIRKLPVFLVPLGALVLAIPLFFSSLDNQVFDLFLRAIPSLTEDDSVVVLTLDDDSIKYGGGFPFPRDVMADVTVLLREIGVEALVFDLNYLDPSPERLNPDYAAAIFSQYLDDGFGRIDEAAVQVIDGFSGGIIKSGEAETIKNEFLGINRSVRRELEGSIAYLTRDVDEYFGKALAFTDNSWLTLTMIKQENLFSDINSAAANTDESFLENTFALKNIIPRNDRRTPQAAGVMPAISTLLFRAKGAGFVNADPDKDGYRRRIDLLIKYQDHYYGHLALAALNKTLDINEIEVSDSAITLKNALVNNIRKDIAIPRAQDGSVLLKYPKKSFYDYRVVSLLECIQYTAIEPVLAQNLALMDESGFFAFWDDGENPREAYARAEDLKNNVSNREQWLDHRKIFFEKTAAFLSGSYEDAIKESVKEDKELSEYVTTIFRAAKEQFSRMLLIRENLQTLSGAFCIIGSDATSMSDTGLITFEEQYPNVGTYAVLANMILSGEFLDDAPKALSFGIAVVLCFILSFFIVHLDTGEAMAAGILTLLLCAFLFVLFFIITKIYIGMVYPLVSMGLAFLSMTGIKFISTSREKSFLRMAFSRYLSPAVIGEIINDPSKLNLGGEKREISAVFTDIQGFSTISEQLDPTHLVTLLNVYLTEMSDIILKNRGTIDKYEGDAIIAFFGAPLYQADHAASACYSAIGIKKAEKELNKKIREENLSPSPLYTRVGINTGDMVVGNMGTVDKMNYTIMGNAVNLAARLEGVNKQYHTGGILISEYTKNQAGEDFLYRSLDQVRVVGINTPVRLYELLGVRAEAKKDSLVILSEWEKAMLFFENQQYRKAAFLFRALAEKNPGDQTAKFYESRCIQYLKNPPPPDWDGVHNLSQK
ncbi:CHASE2 domain-containing protein [Leadbettera azotonutricia]|uniref:Adenylate/guanylate cyclase catalytic domain protein n=1 Tax=Leadbettera azotonutricia (strain ATCC BAA-888 / DSM 13862 / ZAS-9) TaxID=545695 RepID=F5YAP5_LEAAZ|nr:adenylate/guanylate cyclase domain-containing protein [Leadbettera azotonutricia]AEF82233.1 adenylate/guanylate cyclase catalytic domain protein [Leadbettera azotonutricia ZAS-9]